MQYKGKWFIINVINHFLFIYEGETKVEKQSFEINLPVPAIVGAITGAGVANKTMKNQLIKQQAKQDNTTVLSGDYYSQVDNMANNMKVTFTPFSVIYSLKNGAQYAQFETISTESMNRSMYTAWQQRDSMYFKNLILNKVKSEIQFAEQQYSRNIINKHLEMGKRASYDILPFELFQYASNIANTYKKDGMDKVASVMFSEYDNEVVKISMTIEDPSKFSDTIGGNLDFMKINKKNDLDDMQGRLLSPFYIKTHGKVAFLPDRVLFMVDNLVVTSMIAIDMNAEAFDFFVKKDENYFKDLFDRETKMGIKRMLAKLPEKKNLIKEASALMINVNDIFTNSFIHPFIYYKVLTDKYTDKWLSFDVRALVKIIETDFDLVEPIGDIALNKIMSVQSVNKAVLPFENPHAFEKIIRSFSSLPISWVMPESEDITIKDFAFGLDCFDMVTPDNDVYDDFSEDVFSYLIKCISKLEFKIFMPDMSITRSDENAMFYKILNEFLLNTNQEIASAGVTDLKKRSDIIQREELLQKSIIDTLMLIKDDKIDIADSGLSKGLSEFYCPDDLIELGSKQLRDCIEVDMYVSDQNKMLEGQMYMYGLSI